MGFDQKVSMQTSHCAHPARPPAVVIIVSDNVPSTKLKYLTTSHKRVVSSSMN